MIRTIIGLLAFITAFSQRGVAQAQQHTSDLDRLTVPTTVEGTCSERKLPPLVGSTRENLLTSLTIEGEDRERTLSFTQDLAAHRTVYMELLAGMAAEGAVVETILATKDSTGRISGSVQLSYSRSAKEVPNPKRALDAREQDQVGSLLSWLMARCQPVRAITKF